MLGRSSRAGSHEHGCARCRGTGLLLWGIPVAADRVERTCELAGASPTLAIVFLLALVLRWPSFHKGLDGLAEIV